jgi:phenylacetate-coenzyme A ligase PaaK-like adenylate-forming protein
LAGLSRGVLVLSTGGGKVMGTAGNIRAIDRMKPSLIIGMPGYTYHLLRVAANEEHDFSSVTKVVLGAEKVTQGMKDKMTALLEQMGSKKPLIFGTYGFTEARMAWGECPAAPGISSGYHTYPDMEIFEVIDPDTGEHVGEGEDGELVYTTLNARGSCVVRYRTGDLARGGIVTNQCPYCGRNVPRISSDITRVSNVKELKATKIKGTLVNLNSIGEVLSSNKVVDEWQVEIGKRNNDPFELDELVLNISLQQGAEREPATDRLKEELRLATELTPSRINVLSLNDMLTKLGMETELKERRIVDKRPNN